MKQAHTLHYFKPRQCVIYSLSHHRLQLFHTSNEASQKWPYPPHAWSAGPFRIPLLKPKGFPRWFSGEEPACQFRRCRRHGFRCWVGMIPWRRKWQPTPVFLPGESHGQRRLAGYHSWGSKESDMTKHECLIEVMFYNFCSSLFLAINY